MSSRVATVSAPAQRIASAQPPEPCKKRSCFSPVPLTLAQTDGFNLAPTREYPNIWHVEAGTTEQRAALGVAIVPVPHRAGRAPVWDVKRVDTAGGCAVEITIGGRRHTIRFPSPGGDQPVQVQTPPI